MSENEKSLTADKKKPAKKKGVLNSKKFKYGGLSVLFTIVFIVAVVLVNVVITLVGERFSVRADLTDAGLYSIEDSSAEYLSKVEDDITITVTMDENTFSTAGTYYYQTNEILKKIASCSGRINLEYVDVISNPGYFSSYSETISQGDIVVGSSTTKRIKVLSYNDYLSITYNEYYYTIESIEANAEQAVVSAVMSVSDTDPVRVAVISGYGETQNQTFAEMLTGNSYILTDLDITITDKISEEFDFVFIFGPTSDYSLEDINKLDNWLDNDGKFGKNMFYVANPTLGESPNLDGLFYDWGFTVEKGTAYQTDSSYAYQSRPTYQVLAAPETEFSDFPNETAALYGDNICPITVRWEAYGNQTVTPILTTYDGAVIKPQNSGDNWKPGTETETGVLNCAVQGVKTRYEGTDAFRSRIIAFGSMEFFSTTFIASAQANNSQLAMNVFNVSCGKQAGITLTPKSYLSSTFEINDLQKNTLGVIFVFVIPIAMLVLGIVIWIRRIHK